MWSNFNDFTQTEGQRDPHMLSERQHRMEIILSLQYIKLMTIMLDLVVRASTSHEYLQAIWVAGCLFVCGANPLKCLLIRPSTASPPSHRAPLHSTSNYFNPVIAQAWESAETWASAGDTRSCKCGHISCHRGLITGPSAPEGLELWPAAGSTEVSPPKIRCQGIFNAPVSIPARLPDSRSDSLVD